MREYRLGSGSGQVFPVERERSNSISEPGEQLEFGQEVGESGVRIQITKSDGGSGRTRLQTETPEIGKI